MPKYDLIFTSIPYFDLEKYEGMEIFKNKEEFIEKVKKYNEKNREKILENQREKGKEKVECPCGSVVSRSNLSKHKKSLKHQNYLKSLEEK